MLNAGTLNRRLSIQRLRKSDGDAMWGPNEAWEGIGSHWASVVPVAAGEGNAQTGVQAAITYQVRLRWSSRLIDLSSHDRLILYRDEGPHQVLDIISVLDDGRRVWLDVTAKEHVGYV